MHLCYLNKEFLGLGYDFYQPTIENYGLMTFELYRCKKCGKLFYKNKIFMPDTFRKVFSLKVESVKEIGYKPIGELIK